MSTLPNGIYDVFVVDVEEHADGTARFELTITSGAFKGALIAVRASHARDDAIMSIGLPGTLRVVDGEPRLSLDE